MDIKIIKLKVRRGLDPTRKSQILDQGEIVYTIDTKRLYVGNGVLSGGDVVGNKNHPPITQYSNLSTLKAEIGDLVTLNSTFYQLTALPSSIETNWIPLSSPLFIGLSSLSSSQIDPQTVNNGIKINGGTLQADINSKFFQISANQISIKPSSIDERELSSSILSNGLSGGSGEKISIDIDPRFFSFFGNKLSLNPTLSSPITSVDTATITLSGGQISQTSIITALTSETPRIVVDEYGRITQADSGIFDTLTGFDAVNPIFNGTPTQSLSGGIAGLSLTTLSAISANSTETSVIVLSSAGFLMFEGNTETRSGSTVGRYAIPIYTY